MHEKCGYLYLLGLACIIAFLTGLVVNIVWIRILKKNFKINKTHTNYFYFVLPITNLISILFQFPILIWHLFTCRSVEYNKNIEENHFCYFIFS